MQNEFEKFAERINRVVGSPMWFVFSILLILLWIPSGFIFGWGDTWQLIINTTTTILTFLMVSLLQTSQNRWEKKMEADQVKEKHNLKVILEEIARLEGEIKEWKDPQNSQNPSPKQDQIS